MTSNTSRNFEIWVEKNMRVELKKKNLSRERENAHQLCYQSIGTLRSEDGDSRENVAEKVNSCSFNLHRDYSKSLTFSNVGEPS